MTLRRKLVATLLVGILAVLGVGCGDGDDGDDVIGAAQAR